MKKGTEFWKLIFFDDSTIWQLDDSTIRRFDNMMKKSMGVLREVLFSKNY
jgi:hypothetical protein